MSTEYIALMNVAARIARQAGDLVYVGRRNGAGSVQTKSSKNTAPQRQRHSV